MNAYNQGLTFGIIFAVLFLVIYILVRKGSGKAAFDQFDERQLAARGRAYQLGFFTFMVMIGIDACLKMMGMVFYVDPLGEFAALFVALIVFAGSAIQNDAFKGYNKSGRSLIIIYVVVTLAQLANTISAIADGSLVAEGKLTLNCLGPICFVSFALILLMLLVKRRSSQLEMAEED